MTTYVITGRVPTPMYDPNNPVFVHHPDATLGQSRINGTPNRKVSVKTEDREVAKRLHSVFKAVFEDITVTKEK